MTTLELAEQIARAVLKAVDCDEISLAPHDSYFNPQWREAWGDKYPDLAADVLMVLHENHSWFCRVSDAPTGETVDDPYEQVELFP